MTKKEHNMSQINDLIYIYDTHTERDHILNSHKHYYITKMNGRVTHVIITNQHP